MERLQGPINPCFLEGHVNVECLEEQENEYGHCSITDNYYGFEDHHVYNNKNLDSTMPFLQMLQELPPYEEPNLHLLLRLQNHHQKNQYPWIISPDWTIELESCVTEAQSPIKSEKSKDPPPPPSSAAFDRTAVQMTHSAIKEKRKRKRTKPSKNREEVESQRMTHIAVERNRRKQMNDHLSSLRSLMPPSFVQRADQASIIGGAIDFVKELEQLLQSLQAEKRMRSDGQNGLTSSDSAAGPFDGFFTSPQYTRYSSSCSTTSSSLVGDEGWTADIEVTMIQSHANVKVLTPRRQGQLVRAIAALEDLHLVVLHLNITSLQSSVFYSINLKIEDDCKLGTADDIATAVHKIFSFINDS